MDIYTALHDAYEAGCRAERSRCAGKIAQTGSHYLNDAIALLSRDDPEFIKAREEAEAWVLQVTAPKRAAGPTSRDMLKQWTGVN